MSETLTATRTQGVATNGGLTLLHGRGMNALNEAYKLPGDDLEHDRLTLQHRLFVRTIGGLYPPEVHDVVTRLLSRLDRDDGDKPAILDVGSGSGAWTVDIASAFPDVRVVGVDLSTAKLAGPPNCTFLIRDLTKGLDEFTSQFDVVHCRCVRGHLGDDKNFVRMLSDILKPGGLLLLSDGVFGAVDEQFNALLPAPVATPFLSYPLEYTRTSNHSSIPVHAPSSTSWFVRWNTEFCSRLPSRPLESQSTTLEDILRDTDGGDFENIVEKMYHIPVGWSGNIGTSIGDYGSETGRLACANFTQFVQSCTPVLLASGLAEDIVQSWATNTEAELLDPGNRFYVRYRYAWAIKRVV